MHSIVPRQLSFPSLRALALALCASGVLVGCGDSLDGAGAIVNTGTSGGTGTIGGNGTASSSGGGVQTSYTIGGNVIGLSGTGLVLANNSGNNLAVTGNGGFTFAGSVANGASYAVTVQSQPVNPQQVCTVSDGTGTVGTVNVASVIVSCTTNFYTVGGSVNGLVGSGLVLQTNGSNNVSVSSSGNYVLSTLASGSNYTVTVMTQPSSPAQTCVVANGTGMVTTANVGNVAITCTTNSYAISGSVSGLSGAGLVLQTNGANPVAIAGSGSYTLATLASGSAYAVTVMTQPGNPSQTCTVGNGTGTVISADVTNVSITCTTNLYSISGSVTGLNGGTALMLQDNGGDNLSVPANGNFTFATQIASNATYAVTVGTQPTNPAQFCRVTNGAGTVTTAAITTVAVHCSNSGTLLFVTNPYDNGGNGTVAAFTIHADGTLVSVIGSPYVPAESQPYALVLDPNGQYLYVADSASALISTDTVAANGALTQDFSTATTGASTNHPFALAIDPTGPYLYVGSTDDNPNGTLEAYSINAGVLAPVTGLLATSVYPSGNDPYGMAIDPTNALLYAANLYDSTLVGYAIGANGLLTAVPDSPFVFQGGFDVNRPYDIAIYPTGGFLYITDQLGETVTEYTYGASGNLVQGVSYVVGAAPESVTIDPTGSFLYVSNSGDGTVSAFTIKQSDGTLTPVTGSPFVSTTTHIPSAATPTAVQVDPSGQFLYVANGDDGTITVFGITQSSGALTQIGAKVLTVLSGGGPSSIAIE